MGQKKAKSKRVTLKVKYKIQKKVKEHKRKVAKLARDSPHLKKTKKDPGIPNLWPFKEALLAKIEKQQEVDSERKQAQKDRRKASVEKKRASGAGSARKSTVASEAPFVFEGENKEEWKTNEQDPSKRRWYFKELKKVVESSDVVLEILDARDPMGCRSAEMEKMIIGQLATNGTSNKRLILVLNKIDLVPTEVVEKWVKYLKRDYPTVAFKSSTQQQRSHIGHTMGSVPHHSAPKTDSNKTTTAELTSLSGCVGAGALLHILKNYCRSLKMKKSIVVGIIGYPNVGKSSLINSLKRTRAVGVSSTAGFTKTIQQIKLDKNISLLDSPGVLFSATDSATDDGLLLRNVVKVEDVPDPLGAVAGIVSRCTMEQLCDVYKIAEFKGHEEFLSHVAHKRGKLGKGGIPNLLVAARGVLKDWNEGKIPFWTLPPADKNVESTEIVSAWSAEFDIDKLLAEPLAQEEEPEAEASMETE